MGNILIYCDTEGGRICDGGLELLTKGRFLASRLGFSLNALVVGHGVRQFARQLHLYGAEKVFYADDERLKEYLTLPYCRIATVLAQRLSPEIFLFGATDLGRDLAPRVAAELKTGITADCTSLEVGDYVDKEGNLYRDLLYQIRPSFVANQLTTIVSPVCRPQMASIREGVMKMEPLAEAVGGEDVELDAGALLQEDDFRVEVVERHDVAREVDLKSANVIVAGGYGVGSRENFKMLDRLADVLGGQTGATRAAVDAGYADGCRMIGQTGLTVAPKLYFAFGISGQVQHTVGMSRSEVVVSVNSDPYAPIHKIADYAIVGDMMSVARRLIQTINQNRH